METKPRTATEAFVWASEVKGLGIRIKPSGTRSYLIQYRNQARRTSRMVLGHCGVVSLEEARSLAREKLVEVIKGEDPSAARKTLLRSRTVADLRHWYLAEAESGRLLGRKRRPIKAFPRKNRKAGRNRSLHTLRHTFASMVAKLGFSELTIAGLLGHSARGVTQHYVHLDEAQIVVADRVSQRISLLLGSTCSTPGVCLKLTATFH